jgi:hypothetical protein
VYADLTVNYPSEVHLQTSLSFQEVFMSFLGKDHASSLCGRPAGRPCYLDLSPLHAKPCVASNVLTLDGV